MRCALLLSTALLCACGYDRKMSGVIAAYDSGQYQQAATNMQPLLQEYSDAPINGVVFNLDGGSVLRAADDLPGSMKCFDTAYATVRPYLDQEAETKITEEAAASSDEKYDHITSWFAECLVTERMTFGG